MFDIIGKRNWFFAISLAVTIPGLIFILLTPFTGGKAGLKFAIDYTGGTIWSIRFQNPDVTPAQVVDVLTAQNLPGSTATREGTEGFIEIRTLPLLAASQPSASPAASASAGASASGSAGASPSASANPSVSASAAASPSTSAGPSPSASAGPSASASPGASASASAAASASPSGSASASPGGSAAASPVASGVVASGNTKLPTEGKLGAVRLALEKDLGPIAEQRQLTTVGPVVTSDLITQALILILVGSGGILLWITFRFRDVKFGATALVALLHDVLVVVGVFAMLGTFVGLEIDSLFVTAMLTVIGFSVHDTIVVFDRIRENKARHAGEPFDRIVNHSILQTFGRSITTSFTVVLTLLVLFLFSGSAIRTFVLALLLGIISGTYSSIFNAAPLLVVWQQWEDKRRGRNAQARTVRRAPA
ncbi:MAG: protein translocase subunit SecF [Chloroflexota bacterium]